LNAERRLSAPAESVGEERREGKTHDDPDFLAVREQTPKVVSVGFVGRGKMRDDNERVGVDVHDR